MLSVHSILLFSELVDECVLVELNHVVSDEVALLAVNLHNSVLVDQTEWYITLLCCFCLCADRTECCVSADSVEVLTCLEVDLSSCDALSNESVLSYACLLSVDNSLSNCERCLEVAEVIWSVECPEWSRTHAVVL